jgi:hypothetical protein
MPIENEIRLCIHAGCAGRQTYRKNAAPPGWHTWTTNKERQSAWVCGSNPEHFDRE